MKPSVKFNFCQYRILFHLQFYFKIFKIATTFKTDNQTKSIISLCLLIKFSTKGAAESHNAFLKKPPIMIMNTTQSINSSVEPKHQIYM